MYFKIKYLMKYKRYYNFSIHKQKLNFVSKKTPELMLVLS